MEVATLRKELVHTFVELHDTRVLDDVDRLDRIMMEYFGQAYNNTTQEYE